MRIRHKNRKTDETKGSGHKVAASDRSIDSLVDGLGSHSGREREKCRTTLEKMGEPALDPLIKALSDHRKMVRWEAAKALKQFRNPRVVPALLDALVDKAFGVRWLQAKPC